MPALRSPGARTPRRSGGSFLLRLDPFPARAYPRPPGSVHVPAARWGARLCGGRLEDRDDPRSFRLIAANPAAGFLSSLPTETLLGKTMAEGFPKLFETDVPAACRQVILSGRESDLPEVRCGYGRLPDSTFSVKIFPLSDDCVGVVFDDITERKRTEEALKHSESRYRWLFDSIRDTHLIVSVDRTILDCNTIFTSMFGYEREE